MRLRSSIVKTKPATHVLTSGKALLLRQRLLVGVDPGNDQADRLMGTTSAPIRKRLALGARIDSVGNEPACVVALLSSSPKRHIAIVTKRNELLATRQNVLEAPQADARGMGGQRMLSDGIGLGVGGPAGIRTQDQGIHCAPVFPPGVDYLITRVIASRST
jgi:hypothetical protein